MKQKQILFSIIGIIVLFGLLYGVYKLVSGGPDATLVKKVREERPTARTVWNAKASHTLTVFSDFQCPACKVFDDYLAGFEDPKNTANGITKKVAFTYRYFPLYQIHEHAYPLAYAAEAAARQGKFEAIRKRFFADQTKLETVTDLKPYLADVAKSLKLDAAKFNKDMNDPTVQNAVQNDLQLGENLGVNATPTFFLDGEKLESTSPLDLTQLLKNLK